jgi:hypothetical protein
MVGNSGLLIGIGGGEVGRDELLAAKRSGKEGPMEKAGKKADKTIEKAEKKVEKAADAVKKKTE